MRFPGTTKMMEREERRFVEVPRESIKIMAESTGVELSEEVAALLAEDVCYRLREATQVFYKFVHSCLKLYVCLLHWSIFFRKHLKYQTYQLKALLFLGHNRTAHSS